MIATGQRVSIRVPIRSLSACYLVFLVAVLPSADSVVCAQQLHVGASQVEITPPVGFRKGGGYGEVISTGVHDPLFCKAIVLRQGKVAAALVVNDLLSVPRVLSQQARQRASDRTGIPAENIVIAATHNHGSPEYWGSLRRGKLRGDDLSTGSGMR